jgi:hypothetical protein
MRVGGLQEPKSNGTQAPWWKLPAQLPWVARLPAEQVCGAFLCMCSVCLVCATAPKGAITASDRTNRLCGGAVISLPLPTC